MTEAGARRLPHSPCSGATPAPPARTTRSTSAPSDDEIARRLRLGEDGGWEFKEIAFAGDRPRSPRRDDLADEIAAFANTDGGVLLCGVTDAGAVQGMSRAQMDALERLVVEVCADAVRPPVRAGIFRRELEEGRPFLLVDVPQGDALPNAVVMATRYRGADRATGQADAQTITGPLDRQIAHAVAFAIRNMRVSARKEPARVDVPEYSARAIFEALVNAVAHRDYSIRGSRIRLSMFDDRLEIQSPGSLPNNLTVDSIPLRQSARNELLVSVLGRMPAGRVPGSGDRRFFMERRGDGVPTIVRETKALSGETAEFQLIDDADLCVVLPAAPVEPSPARPVVTVRTAAGAPLPGADVLALFPNRSWRRAATDEAGAAVVDLHTTALPMTVFVAAPGYAAHLEQAWRPDRGALAVVLDPRPDGGSVIFPEATGNLPGLAGALNPVRDTLDRLCLYTSNIAVNEGQAQPVPFVPGEELRLTDAGGRELLVRIAGVTGRSALVEYRSAGP